MFQWKKRLFVLRKCLGEAYTLNYYTMESGTEEKKGCINVSEIQRIERGSECPKEDLTTTLRVCKCPPEKVLVIRTEKRNFFLVTDEEKQEIDSWCRCLTDILNTRTKSEFSGTLPLTTKDYDVTNHYDFPSRHSITGAQQETKSDTRPSSFPANYAKSGITMTEEEQRKRSATAPALLSNAFHSQCFISPQQSFPIADSDSNSDSDTENIYQVPRRLKMSIDDPSKALDKQEASDTDTESGVYEDMHGYLPQFTMTSRTPQSTEESATLTKNKEKQLTPLDLIKIRFEQMDAHCLQKKEITVRTEYLQKYLEVLEVGECLYIYRWNGPNEIGCIFHHGDHIDHINEFRVRSQTMFHQLLNISVQKSVKLNIFTDCNAPVFHVDGCSCAPE
ncbi:hypothetical protein GDO86_019749 [Hymenochirus boettgeri]|uniref:PH domain-containing protein n=1 Tax=Hymenochirus boettgeri TaxID=247094 RepID=A0A8T2IJ63_9PIPI|nr:hypothetical protein GDO86_019749 [Hymenochirus boettgeri]